MRSGSGGIPTYPAENHQQLNDDDDDGIEWRKLGIQEGMWAITRGGFYQKLLNFPKTISRPLMATSNLIRVSSPAYSTGSLNNVPSKRVGTHSGSFHCDEALGCFMICLTTRFSNSEIVRTRDPKVLEGFDAVLDVGGVYDPSRDRYDHHQKGFEEVFGHGFNTKLSSAGLVYKVFIISSRQLKIPSHSSLLVEIIAKELQLGEDHPDVQRLFLAIYKNFMEAIDAIDNGINQFDTDKPPRYVNNTNLSSRVGRLNLDWMDHNQSPEKENEAFQQAMALAGSEFLDVSLMTIFQSVRFHAKSWLPARSIVMECIADRYDTDPSGEIMVLKRFTPVSILTVSYSWLTIIHPLLTTKYGFCCIQQWKLHIFELEEEMKVDPPIKYVLYDDDRGKRWRVQAVAISPDRFESRKPLPAQWRGLTDDELSKEAGIPGCIFVHISGFTGGNQTYEGALAMARTALKI
ncbi:protein-like isoform X1 [Gossypium australe]|uniref:Protein-like isoform X1 n=1 Tax=Gossypium australe TaxID=47621 RepID=A0A5B6UE55_9ROSI|nr:protein-like isoform X1 [Gossypium australe]